LNFELHDIGEFMGPSKQHIIWHFTLDSVLHKVELFDSIFTGRRRVKIDNQEVVDTGRVGFFGNEQFNYRSQVDQVGLELTEGDDCFVLNLNNIPFSQLYLKEKQRKREAKNSRRQSNKLHSKNFWNDEGMRIGRELAQEKNMERLVEVEIDLDMIETPQIGLMATPFDFDED
jgi:hypothetical protein